MKLYILLALVYGCIAGFDPMFTTLEPDERDNELHIYFKKGETDHFAKAAAILKEAKRFDLSKCEFKFVEDYIVHVVHNKENCFISKPIAKKLMREAVATEACLAAVWGPLVETRNRADVDVE